MEIYDKMKKEIKISKTQIFRLIRSILLSIVTLFVIHHFGSFYGSGSPSVQNLSAYSDNVYTANDLIQYVGYSCPLGVSHRIETEGRGITWGNVFNFGNNLVSDFREITYFTLIFDGHWNLLIFSSIIYFLIFTFFNHYRVIINK